MRECGNGNKPNVVFLFCDELRCDALSCYKGAPEGIATPNLDWLAGEGALFEQCFCNSPVCVPSRFSLLTGLYPETTGVYHNEAAGRELPRRERYTTIPEVLERHGYRTANFGKQHLPMGINPFGIHNPQGGDFPAADVREYGSDIIATRGIKSLVGGVYSSLVSYPPEQVTNNALFWMEAQKEPYFIRISYLQPHTPVVVPEPYASMYSHVEFPIRDKVDAKLSEFERRFADNADDGNLTPEQVHLAKVRYYGLVRWIDDQVGEILKFLREKGQLENTILLFGADHGAMLGENHRYAKQNFALWSHRVPFIIYDRNSVPVGQRRTDLCENVDIGKTLFGLLGIEPPEQFQGRNLFSEERVEYVYGTIGYGEPDSYTFPNKKYGTYTEDRGWPRRACIRSLQYRLDMNVRLDGEVPNGEDEDIFLTDLSRDASEQFNCSEVGAYREIRDNLKEHLLSHIRKEQEREWG